MLTQHRTTAAILVVLLIPFGIAIYQDAHGRSGRNALFGAADDWDFETPYDDSDQYEDYDQYDDYAALDDLDYEEALDDLEDDTRRVMDAAFFDAVFFDGGKATKPLLTGPLTPWKLGTPRSTIDSDPDLYMEQDAIVPGYEAATVHWNYGADDAVERLTVGFPDDGSAIASFVSQWGPGTKVGDVELWSDADNKLGVVVYNDYDHSEVVFEHIQSLNEFVAPSSARFGFESEDLFKLSKEEIAALPGMEDEAPYLFTQRIDGTARAPAIQLSVENGKIDGIFVNLQLGDQRDAFVELLTRKLGSPKKVSEDYDYGSTLVFPTKKGRQVRFEEPEYDSDSTLEIHRK